MEAVLHFGYMTLSPRVNGLLYLRHGYAAELEGFARLRKVSTSIDPEFDFDESRWRNNIKELEQRILEVRPNFDLEDLKRNDWRGWSGKSTAWMAKDLGEDAERQYMTTFWILSGYTHPSPLWMQSLRVDGQNDVLVDARPSNSYVRPILVSALCYYLIASCYAVSDFFGLGKEQSIKEFEDRFRKLGTK